MNEKKSFSEFLSCVNLVSANSKIREIERNKERKLTKMEKEKIYQKRYILQETSDNNKVNKWLLRKSIEKSILGECNEKKKTIIELEKEDIDRIVKECKDRKSKIISGSAFFLAGCLATSATVVGINSRNTGNGYPTVKQKNGNFVIEQSNKYIKDCDEHNYSDPEDFEVNMKNETGNVTVNNKDGGIHKVYINNIPNGSEWNYNDITDNSALYNDTNVTINGYVITNKEVNLEETANAKSVSEINKLNTSKKVLDFAKGIYIKEYNKNNGTNYTIDQVELSKTRNNSSLRYYDSKKVFVESEEAGIDEKAEKLNNKELGLISTSLGEKVYPGDYDFYPKMVSVFDSLQEADNPPANANISLIHTGAVLTNLLDLYLALNLEENGKKSGAVDIYTKRCISALTNYRIEEAYRVMEEDACTTYSYVNEKNTIDDKVTDDGR